MDSDPINSLPTSTNVQSNITAEDALKFFNAWPDVFTVSDMRTFSALTGNATQQQLNGLYGSSFATFLEVIHPDDRQMIMERLANSTIETAKETVECRCPTPDGGYRWMEWRTIPFPNENKLYSIGRDISQRKAAELRSEQLAAIVKCASDGIIGVDLDYRITSWNQGAENIFGYRLEDVEGTSVNDLFNFKSGEILCGTGGVEKELICLRQDGRKLDVSATMSDVFGDGKHVVAYAVFVRDISERKVLQKRVTEFYSTVSHELRTPLTSIRGVLSLILGGVIDITSSEAMEMIQVAKESSERLIRLVNDILDIQKIEADKLELKTSEVAPVDLMRQAVKETEGMAESLTITIDAVADQCLPTLMADSDKVVQVLTNLISNAVKFSPKGETISVRAGVHEKYVRFSVSDQGTGIPPEQAHKLFGKFQQLDSSDSRQHGGTGLGLAICKAMVEQHGGSIGFYNGAPGCTFWFELPSYVFPHT